jgi:hypothetical protein
MIHSGTDFLNINYLFLSIIIYFAANIKLINKLLSTSIDEIEKTGRVLVIGRC